MWIFCFVPFIPWLELSGFLFELCKKCFTQSNIMVNIACSLPDSKIHGADVGPNWGRQDPGGLHVGPMNFAIWASLSNGIM